MFLKRNTKRVKGKVYYNYLLVESIATPKGPRHRTVVALGSLDPGPREQWAELAKRLYAALVGQQVLVADPDLDAIVERSAVALARASSRRSTSSLPAADTDVVAVHTDRVEVEQVREAGSIHVAHQMWERLGLSDILAKAGFGSKARTLTEILTINRLVRPCSEHATPDWVRRTALGDILGVDVSKLGDDALYRHLDDLHPQRGAIERGLVERERSLFNLSETLLLYDMTSTYFEGKCEANKSAKRGYSRDHRGDCKQVVVGLALDGDGFAKAHEVFDGNTVDRTSIAAMLDVLEERMGKRGGATVVVDRGFAYDETIAEIRSRGYHFMVAGRPGERVPWFDEFEDDGGWREVEREPSPRNPNQKKSAVSIKRASRREGDDETRILCHSEGRVAKDRAIREKQEGRLLADLEKLGERVTKGRLRAEARIHEAIGRIRERYPRVARYWEIELNAADQKLVWREDEAKKAKAASLDGCYLIRTSRTDMTDEEIWRTYMMLTRVENAFRDMKGPLMERPIYHQLQRRVETHIFLCVLAYHLLVCVERTFLDAGIHTSWEAIRDVLATHQVLTVLLPATNGRTLRIRKGSLPEAEQKEIYRVLGIPDRLMAPIKEWVDA